MKTGLLAVALLALLPACGCLRKKDKMNKQPKKEMGMKKGGMEAKNMATKKGAAKTHMDMYAAE